MSFEKNIFSKNESLEEKSSKIISPREKIDNTKNDLARLREELKADYKNFNNPDFYFSGGKSEMEKSILEKENTLRSLEINLSSEIATFGKTIRNSILKLREELKADYKNFNNPDFYFSGGKSEMDKSILEKENTLRSLELEQQAGLDEGLIVEDEPEIVEEPVMEVEEDLISEPVEELEESNIEPIVESEKPFIWVEKSSSMEDSSEPVGRRPEDSSEETVIESGSNLIVEEKSEEVIEEKPEVVVETKEESKTEDNIDNNLESVVELNEREVRKEKSMNIFRRIQKKLGLKYAAAAIGIFTVGCSTSPSEKEQQAVAPAMEKTFQSISVDSVNTNKQETPILDTKVDASGKASGEIRKTPITKKEIPTEEVKSVKIDSVDVASTKIDSIETNASEVNKIDSVETNTSEVNKIDSTVVLEEDQPVDFSKLKAIDLDEIIKKEMESKIDSTKVEQDSSIVTQSDTSKQETVKVKKNFFQRLFNFKGKKADKIDNILPMDSIPVQNISVDSVSTNVLPTDSVATEGVLNTKMSNGGHTMETGNNTGGRSGLQSMPFSGLDDGNNEASNRALYTENNILSKNNIKSDNETVSTLDAFSKGKTFSTETPKKSGQISNTKGNSEFANHANKGNGYSNEDIVKEKIKNKLKFQPIKVKDSVEVKTASVKPIEIKPEQGKPNEIKSEQATVNTPKVENIAPQPEANLFVIDKGEGYNKVIVDASLAEYFPEENSSVTIEKQGEDYFVADKGDGYTKVIIDASLAKYFPKENSNITVEKQGEDYFVIDKGDGYSKVIIDSSAQNYLSNNEEETTPEVGADVYYESKGDGYSEVILDASLYKYLPKKDSVVVVEKINDEYYIKSKNKDATPVILDASVMKYFPEGNEVKIERQGDEIRIEGSSTVILDPSLGITKEDYEKYLRGKSAKKLTQ